MIFTTEILYLVFVIFTNEAIAQFQTLMHAIVTPLDRLHSSFCMHMYGCELWDVSSTYTDKYIIAWNLENSH